MKEHIIVRIVAKFFTPFIQLFAFYVIAHGDLGPGGGFQGV
jgi:multicomponent Na+:H+ antiporter subunit B